VIVINVLCGLAAFVAAVGLMFLFSEYLMLRLGKCK